MRRELSEEFTRAYAFLIDRENPVMGSWANFLWVDHHVGEVSATLFVGCFSTFASHVSLDLVSHHRSDLEGDSFSSDTCT